MIDVTRFGTEDQWVDSKRNDFPTFKEQINPGITF
jgi:hypothetical protein